MPKELRLNRLTAMAVQHLATPGRHSDGGGLYLEISASGASDGAYA